MQAGRLIKVAVCLALAAVVGTLSKLDGAGAYTIAIHVIVTFISTAGALPFLEHLLGLAGCCSKE
ncbi:hypothetical protein [Nocardiopsis aegyptia]|uniref:Uncharacterized protein n=1 Tax=Nocardiopsis aegyptia TaxID=220378 RepID=A0A7Z0EK55_9ACTN|nr:hypothetical protein [Nocardiopsis aegyptia]NYJ33447.1 hypothetical protein [Nocardiopsis aegyptia]